MHQDFTDFMEDIQPSLADETVKNIGIGIRQYDEWLSERDIPPLDASKRDIHRFLRSQSQQYSAGTVKLRYYAVKKFYDYSEKWDAIEDNPMDDLTLSDYTNGQDTKKSKQADIVYITPEEKEALCEHVPKPTLRNEFLIRLLWQTGMRRCEASEIELGDIDRERRAIDIWSPKTEEWRTVFYQPSLDFYLDQWLDGGYRSAFMYADDADYLFVSENSPNLSEYRMNDIVKIAAENAGIQEVMYEDSNGHERRRITAHALRHGHAVEALKSGIDIKRVSDHLGHSSLDITEKYLQLLDEDVREAYARFGTAEG